MNSWIACPEWHQTRGSGRVLAAVENSNNSKCGLYVLRRFREWAMTILVAVFHRGSEALIVLRNYTSSTARAQ